jgi:cation diffusion facilitator CzcD-associated flavoprotein CzcO
MIIDGKIKLKNDSLIERFTETGIRFEDGSELDADVIIFSTGYNPIWILRTLQYIGFDDFCIELGIFVSLSRIFVVKK